MTYVYDGGIWRNISAETQIGWSRGGTNIFGDVIPASDTWGNAVKVAGEDIGYGAIGGLYIAGAYDAYKVVADISRKRKRPNVEDYTRYIPKMKRSSNSGDTNMYEAGNSAPAGVQQTTYHKRRYRGVKRKPLLKRIYENLRELENDSICRWQSITTPQPTTLGLLSQNMANYLNAAKNLYTSCYCFNLSALGRQNNQGWKLYPWYRLVKDTNANYDAQAWTWEAQSGANCHADGSSDDFAWQQEHYESSFGLSAPKFRHDWSDVKIMLQGTIKYPTRFHIYRVRFMLDGLGPRREYRNASEVLKVFDSALDDAHDIAEVDYFWERFMGPKIVHPFFNTKKTGLQQRQHLKVISHEVVNLGADVTIANDVQPLQHIHSMFIKSGKMYDTTSAIQVERDLMPVADPGPPAVTTCGIKGDGNVGYSDVNNVSTHSAYVTDRSKDEWLMIVAENYQQSGDGYEPAKGIDANNTPSLDIRVRSKWTEFKMS